MYRMRNHTFGYMAQVVLDDTTWARNEPVSLSEFGPFLPLQCVCASTSKLRPVGLTDAVGRLLGSQVTGRSVNVSAEFSHLR